MLWPELLGIFGGTVGLVAGAAWLSRALIGQALAKDLQAFKNKTEIDLAVHKANLDRSLSEFKVDAQLKGEKELEQLRHNYALAIEQRKIGIQGEASSKERIRLEILRWANPILSAVESLDSRLHNILMLDGWIALSKEGAVRINPNWSMTYRYMKDSTLYLFAAYFCWVRMLQELMSFEMFADQREKDSFFAAIKAVSKELSAFPTPSACRGKDQQVFALQQQAIGELLMKGEVGDRGGTPACMTYSEFLGRLEDELFSQRLEPLSGLLEGLRPDDECRWNRLKATHERVGNLRAVCSQLLNIEAPRR